MTKMSNRRRWGISMLLRMISEVGIYVASRNEQIERTCLVAGVPTPPSTQQTTVLGTKGDVSVKMSTETEYLLALPERLVRNREKLFAKG